MVSKICVGTRRYLCTLAILVVTLAQLAAATSSDNVVYIKGGTVVNADQQFKADVLIVDGIITGVGQNLQVPVGARALDATGKFVMPGGIDPHTHLAMPVMGNITSCDDYFTGQSAALAGGTTMHIDFALPVAGDLMAGLKEWQRKAERAVMPYSWHMAITQFDDKVAKDMGTLANLGINSFKFFMAYKGIFQVSDELLLAGFRRCKELGAIALVHTENGDAIVVAQQRTFDAGITGPEGHAISRPAILEGEATSRAIKLAAHVNTPLYLVHVMSKDALDEVVRAKAAGLRVIGEAVASGISLTDAGLWDTDFDKAARFVMSPPIRGAGTAAALRAALAGGLLEVVATDHAVFNIEQKRAGRHDFRKIPNGVNGIEERLHVTWNEMVNSGLINPSAFVQLVSTSVARIYGIYPKKGHVAVGSDADIIIFDPAVEHTITVASHHSAMDTNIYDGMKVKGKVVTTISQGKVVWHDGKLNVHAGAGHFVKLPLFPPIFDGLDRTDATWMSDSFPYGATPVKREGDLPVHDEL